MRKRYLPPSRFLQAAINDEVVFGDLDLEEKNLQRLLALTCDDEAANRDWAIMLLAQLELNRTDVREALLNAAGDGEPVVRGEAILGMALLDRIATLPLLQQELKGQIVTIPLLEAAALVADSSLLPDLEAFSEPSEDEWIDKAVSGAIAA